MQPFELARGGEVLERARLGFLELPSPGVYSGGIPANVPTILRAVFGVYAALAVLLAASVTVGLALWRLSGWERASFCAPAVGFALLLVVTEIASRLPGRTVTACAVAGALVLGSLVVLVSAPFPGGSGLGGGTLMVALSLLLVGLPFIAGGGFGILGEGDNNDMAVHLGAAYWLQTHAVQQDVMLVKPGYPLGPHALAATLGTGLRVSVVQGFTAVMLAVPMLTALAAYAGLERVRPAGAGSARCSPASPTWPRRTSHRRPSRRRSRRCSCSPS